MTDKKSCKTSIPVEQAELWEAEAEDMGVPRSEYIRYMVQAGRRQFAFTETAASDSNNEDSIDIERRVVEALEANGELSWDELSNAVIGDLEDDLEAALGDLEEDNVVRTSFRTDSIRLSD